MAVPFLSILCLYISPPSLRVTKYLLLRYLCCSFLCFLSLWLSYLFRFSSTSCIFACTLNIYKVKCPDLAYWCKSAKCSEPYMGQREFPYPTIPSVQYFTSNPKVFPEDSCHITLQCIIVLMGDMAYIFILLCSLIAGQSSFTSKCSSVAERADEKTVWSV